MKFTSKTKSVTGVFAYSILAKLIVCFQKDVRDHYAKIDGISINSGVITYSDSDGSGSISMDKIQGVMYNDK